MQASEEGLQEEQSHVEELQALLEQERALTLRREREEEERREVRRTHAHIGPHTLTHTSMGTQTHAH